MSDAHTGSSGTTAGDSDRQPQPNGSRKATGPMGGLSMGDLASLIESYGDAGLPPKMVDAVSQVMVAVLGAGPSYAVLESLIAANQANGQMFHNAIAHQQKTNIVGMVATVNCVAKLLGQQPDTMYSELQDQK